jgi:hypothetical protein
LLCLKRVSQEYILTIKFTRAVEREELLVIKCDEYLESLKRGDLTDMVKRFRKNAQEHIRLLKDTMIKLNIQG